MGDGRKGGAGMGGWRDGTGTLRVRGGPHDDVREDLYGDVGGGVHGDVRDGTDGDVPGGVLDADVPWTSPWRSPPPTGPAPAGCSAGTG
ncbi:hypothetical protein SAZ11_22395 [Streptomyces sp. FXJ1.4098]|nr:hypothetical protein [Streptomyces sp. FXJ1.4098]